MLWSRRLAQSLTARARQGLLAPRGFNDRTALGVFNRLNSSLPQNNTGQYAPSPDPTDRGDDEGGRGRKGDSDPNLKSTILKMLETAATTAASIAILG